MENCHINPPDPYLGSPYGPEEEEPITVINSTGRVRYCEDCGERMEPGDSHYCPGPEETR